MLLTSPGLTRSHDLDRSSKRNLAGILEICSPEKILVRLLSVKEDHFRFQNSGRWGTIASKPGPPHLCECLPLKEGGQRQGLERSEGRSEVA